MSIFEFLQKKKDNENEMDFADKPKQETEKKEEFVSNLSYVELQGADWVEFAGILKKDGVLSNSYDKNPASIEYSLDKNNTPVVELTFQSKTSDSVRKVQLFNDRAYLYVNGAIEAFPETQRNKDLNKIWKKFQEEIRYINMLNTNRDGYFHSERSRNVMRKAKKMQNMRNIYDREQEFLEKYKDVIFDGFEFGGFGCMDGEYQKLPPRFIPLVDNGNGAYLDGEPVIPFTPNTLEYCILHMTNGQKAESGMYPENFEHMCRMIQEDSCFEVEGWDEVIEFGKKIVSEKYREKAILEMID